jgi:ABC-2 type transport system permease protein
MIPATLVCWPLMFISGIFVPLEEIAARARGLVYLSFLTHAQDLMNHGHTINVRAVLGRGFLNPWHDLALLPALVVVFLIPAAGLHCRSRVLGYR